MSARFDVNALRIASPCPARWEDMTGDDRARFCRHCQKHVYNFSTMTATEVEQLVLAKEGNLCGRMYRRKDGTVLTADCPTGRAVVKRKRWQWAGGLVAGFTLLMTALWVRATQDGEAEESKFVRVLQRQWFILRVKLGWQPPMVMGTMALPVNHVPPGNPVLPSPPPVGSVNGTATP
jgi:hypothetical protein